MSEPENPLSRWARLKQVAKAQEEIEAASPGSEAMAAPEAPFDPASLPSIESIVGDSDIIAFLRKGVPADLTRAALRKAWASDPAIRDFIGIAENQWDFNDPNAIPGFGPLAPTEAGVDVFAQISSRLRPRVDEDLTAAEPIVPSNEDAGAADRSPVLAEPPLVTLSAVPNKMPVFAADENPSTAGEARNTRRHGSALPR
ncbi:MAG: DUF3306 domain-containing protein [Bradyrhizobium sp.]|jgi:hypothetical protein